MPASTRKTRSAKSFGAGQKGAITMFSAVLILILLTELIIYAVQVGVFEQRKSSNEARYKEAFHVAESGLQYAKEYFLANSVLVASREPDLLSDGTDGWLVTAGQPWRACADADENLGAGNSGEHPCYGESGLDEYGDYAGTLLREQMFFFVNDPEADAGSETTWRLPIDPNQIIDNDTQNVRVYALLCLLDIEDDDPPVQGCIGDDQDVRNPDNDRVDERRFIVTLLSRGEAECELDPETGERVNCKAQARIVEKIGSFSPADNGIPGGVPLTTRSNFPPNGSAEIVTSPNAGGPGVSISAWLQGGNEGCPEQAIVDPSGGSWSTCERHEWYETDAFPEDMACPTANCSCDTDERRLSYAEQGEQKLGFDLVVDPNFPCDLFFATFGYSGEPTNENPPPWQFIKDQATVIDDCSTLNEDSFGFYWATGSDCRINSNTVIGSAKKPVFLVSAASTTTMNGGAQLFGILFVTDVEDPDAEFVSAGTNTIYGAAVIDGSMDKYTGTFQIVYLDSVVELAGESLRFGSVAGGWTDFPQDWR